MTGRNLLLIIFKWVGKSLAQNRNQSRLCCNCTDAGEFEALLLLVHLKTAGSSSIVLSTNWGISRTTTWIESICRRQTAASTWKSAIDFTLARVAVASRLSHPSFPTHSVAKMSWTKSWVNVDSYTENWTRGANLIMITLRAKVSHLWFVSSVRRLKKLSARRRQDGWAAQPGVFTLRVVWTPTRH